MDQLDGQFTLTTAHLATIFNLDKDTVLEYCHAGTLPHLRLTRYTLRFKREDLLRWIEERYVTSPDHPLVKQPEVLPKAKDSTAHAHDEASRARISAGVRAYLARKRAAKAEQTTTT